MRWIEQLALFWLSDPVSRVWAPASPSPTSSPGLPHGAAQEVIDASAGFLLVSAVILLLLIVGVEVKIYHLRRKRDQEAAAIQASLSDALMLAPAGSVPGRGLPQAAVDLVPGEALRKGKGCRVENRIPMDAATLRRGA